MIGCICVLIVASGCTRNRIRQDENNALPTKVNALPNKVKVLPTENELAHANYGKPINIAEFENAVRTTLNDPYSAHISCTAPEKGWYDLTSDRIYGYFSICKVNAKNGFGAYTGEKVDVYEKFVAKNGKEFINKNSFLTISFLIGKNELHIVK